MKSISLMTILIIIVFHSDPPWAAVPPARHDAVEQARGHALLHMRISIYLSISLPLYIYIYIYMYMQYTYTYT